MNCCRSSGPAEAIGIFSEFPAMTGAKHLRKLSQLANSPLSPLLSHPLFSLSLSGEEEEEDGPSCSFIQVVFNYQLRKQDNHS